MRYKCNNACINSSIYVNNISVITFNILSKVQHFIIRTLKFDNSHL